jgi:putative ABC transport system permease protein
MEELLRDIRHALRVLIASPGFTAVAVLALALGIGANTAMFSVVNAVLMRPLPFHDAERLVRIWGSTPSKNIPFHNVFYADAADWKRESRSFEAMSAAVAGSANLTLGDEPERLARWRVNAEFFPMLGTQFQTGRGFVPEEDRPGAPPVVVLTHPLWQRRFGADPKIVGQTVTLDGAPHTVTGVLTSSFEFAGTTIDVLSPIAVSDAREQQSGGLSVTVFARLKPDVTIKQAQTEMNTVGRRLEQFRGSLGTTPRVWGLREFAVRDVKSSLLVLFAAVGLVLLIACANVANLLLARAGTRQKELAVRTALGARRGRIIRQLLTESAMLGLAGGIVGVALAWAGVRALLHFLPGRSPFLADASIDLRVLSFTVAVSLFTGLLFGLVPALVSSRRSVLNEALKEGGRGSGETISRARLRSGLVIAEVGLALVLLIGAGLMIQSFIRLTEVNPGFKAQGLLTAGVSLPASKYPRPSERYTFFSRVCEGLRTLPGVKAVGLTTALPLTQHNTGTGLIIEGRPVPPPEEIPIVWFRIVNAEYFRTMEIPLLKGRLFNDQDQAGPPVALVNQTMARLYWPGEEVVGKRFTSSYPRTDRPTTWITIVGVVRDLHHRGLDVEPDAELFWPYQQHAPSNLSLVLRVDTDAAQFTPLLRKAVAEIDKEQPISQVVSMEERLFNSIAPQQLSVLLLTIFAGFALFLAVVGIYGVISFSVQRRTQEIGIRLALGARQGDVVRLIVAQALLLALGGVAVGLVAAFALTRYLGTLLFGVTATDPVILTAVSLVLISAAVLAAYLPARRAAGVDPLVALRYE